MKRASTKKVKAHSLGAASYQDLKGYLKLVDSKLKWQVRTSTAIAGLAVSIGASSFSIIAGHCRSAIAAEPGSNQIGKTVSAPMGAASSLPTYLVEKTGELVTTTTSNVNASLKANYQSQDRLTNLGEGSNTSVITAKSAETSISNLQTEVQKLREKYPTQTNSQVPTAINFGVATLTSSPTPATIASEQVNSTAPELRFTQAVEPLQSKSQQPQVVDPLVPVLQPLATAPMDVDLSAPSEILNGQQVSPELPPLAAGDIYLPRALTAFKGYTWPAKGVLTSPFGWRWGRIHKGIDIAAPIGTPVFAAATGVVVTAGWNSGGYGNLVDIRHPDGSLTRYAHNSKILVQVGQMVQQGEEISEIGSTGHSTGPHCHFEVHPFGQGAVNPIAYLPH